MRHVRKLSIIAVSAVVVATTVVAAGAFITSSSGGVIRLASAPPSVALNALENATSAVTFDEQQGLTLPADVQVDFAAPGTYAKFPSAGPKLAAGLSVDSHLVHSDPPNGTYSARRSGSVTFAGDVVGIVASTRKLSNSDFLGATGTTYSGLTAYRGLESGEDNVTISADRRTVSFNFRTTQALDEFRIITAHANPLSVSINQAPNPVQAGSNVAYTITVTNNGNSTVPNVILGDEFPGATLFSATSSGGCTGTTSVTCDLGSIAVGGNATATVVVTSPITVPSGGLIVNTASAPAGETPFATASTTVVSPVLDTTITDSPDPVTAGNNVQYTLTVTNHGIAPVADAHVIDTLPTDTTLVSASAPGNCTGSGPVDCTLGPLAVNDSAIATVVVTSPASVPDSGSITDSATASPGSNPTATETTTVEASEPGVAKGFVVPGGSITIPGDNPATVALPDTGDGAPIVITQGDGSFCDGPCAGPATTISDFPGYSDPLHPIRLTLTYTFPAGPTSLTDAATAFGSTIYKNDDPMSPNLGAIVPTCATPGGGVAAPHPCVDARSITQPTFNSFVVTFEILYLSGDPRFARR